MIMVTPSNYWDFSSCGIINQFLVVIDVLTGIIERRIVHGPKGVLYLPQKPFLTDGSLRQQVCQFKKKEVLLI